MSTKNIEELTEEIKEKLIDFVKNSTQEIYWDYRDSLSKEQYKDLFKAKTLEEFKNNLNDLECELWENCIEETNRIEDYLIENAMSESNISEDLQDEVRELLQEYFNIDLNEKDLYKNTSLNMVLTLYSNYDCLNSNWLESQSGYSYKESYFGDLLDTLNINPQTFKKRVKELGYFPVAGKFPNYKYRDGKEVVSIDSLIRELENTSSGANLLTFIVETTLDEAIEMFEKYLDSKYVSIKKGTMCGLFDSFNGGGSVLELKVVNGQRKIKLKKDEYTHLTLNVEEGVHHYTIDKVYGMCRGYCSNGGFEFS